MDTRARRLRIQILSVVRLNEKPIIQKKRERKKTSVDAIYCHVTHVYSAPISGSFTAPNGHTSH